MLEKVFLPKKEIVSRPILDEMILVPIRGNLADMQKVFTLNSVAQYVWEHLDGTATMGDILSGVVEQFDVKKEIAQADLSELMTDLTKHGLVTEVV